MKPVNAPARVGASVLAILVTMFVSSLAAVAVAQVNTTIFKNFHRYPASGLWSQELSGTRNGVSMGPPTKTTSCTAAADPVALAQIQKAGNTNAASCKTSVITDTERVAEYERTCTVAGSPHVTHSTMKMVDDKTLTIDTRDDVRGLVQTVLHSNVTYLGTCTAPANKPSASECAELAAAEREPAASEAECAQAPAAYRAQCLSQIAASRKTMDTLRAQCRG